MLIIPPNHHPVSQWTGGSTTQLFIWPPEADFAKRDFVFRISTATVETANSTFTRFHGYQRILILMNGELTIQHNDDTPFILPPLTFHQFDGGWETTAKGIVTDFNIFFKPELNATTHVQTVSSKLRLHTTNEKTFHFGYLALQNAILNNRPIDAGSFILFAPGETYEIESNGCIWITGNIHLTDILLHSPKTIGN